MIKLCEVNVNTYDLVDEFMIKWIQDNVELRHTDSVSALYNHMESQSGESLAVIYKPFDSKRTGHFADRGQILDIAFHCNGGRVLDFGPGDGWPSLLIAPMVNEVVGVDGSETRVDVCTQNAERLDIRNAHFVHTVPGEELPFENNSFDAVCAASSIEQTPDPLNTLREIHRVLKPEGKLRMHYESLSYYQNGREREVGTLGQGNRTALIIYDRDIEGESVTHYKLEFNLTENEIMNIISCESVQPAFSDFNEENLDNLRDQIVDAFTWKTKHPSCKTFLRLLQSAGFSAAVPAYNGGDFALQYFKCLSETEIPVEIEHVDEMLSPVVKVVIKMEAPSLSKAGVWDPWITAVK